MIGLPPQTRVKGGGRQQAVELTNYIPGLPEESKSMYEYYKNSMQVTQIAQIVSTQSLAPEMEPDSFFGQAGRHSLPPGWLFSSQKRGTLSQILAR